MARLPLPRAMETASLPTSPHLASTASCCHAHTTCKIHHATLEILLKLCRVLSAFTGLASLKLSRIEGTNTRDVARLENETPIISDHIHRAAISRSDIDPRVLAWLSPNSTARIPSASSIAYLPDPPIPPRRDQMNGNPVPVLFLYSLYLSPKNSTKYLSSLLILLLKKYHNVATNPTNASLFPSITCVPIAQ